MRLVFVDGSSHSGVAYCDTNSVNCSNVASSTFRTGRMNPSEVRFIKPHVSRRCFDWFGCIDSTAYARLDCARLRGCVGAGRREHAADEAREHELGKGRSTRALETRSLAVVVFSIGIVLGLNQMVSMLIPCRRVNVGTRYGDSVNISV